MLVVALVVASYFNESGTVRLFIDPRFVDPATISGFSTTVGPVTKDAANPLLVEDRLYDVRWDNTYITSMYDSITGKYRLWYNGFISCTEPYNPDADKPGVKNSCAHPTWHTTFGKEGLKPWPGSPQARPASGLMYADSSDGIKFTKREDLGVPYPWDGKRNSPLNKTNILEWGDAASGTGIIFDEHETNASRRYKALGSFWNYGNCGRRPENPVHGTPWPPCHCLGISYSSDGIRFDHPNNVSAFDPGNAPGLDKVGQDDGALDLAIWDEDLGAYWGLVRVDAASDGNFGHRRTGRFTTKDFVSFSAAEQVSGLQMNK
jgi:hypothetical protein